MTMKIKKALPADAEVLAGIIRKANIPVAHTFGLTRENVPNHPAFCTRDWILDGMERGEEYYLAQTDDSPAGCVAYDGPEPGVAFLNRLAVLPEVQGRGTGRALVAHVKALARSRGKRKISIGIIKAHTRLRDWYAGLGFVAAGTRQFDHLPFDVLFMHLDLG